MRLNMLGIGALLIAGPASAQMTVARSAPHYQVVGTAAAGGALPGQVTLGVPTLVGNLSRSSVILSLQMVTLAWGSSLQVWMNPGRSNLVLAGDSGKVRVRYNFAFQPGVSAVPTTLTLHSGQLPSDPAVGTCALTPAASHCDTVVDAMSHWWLTASLDNGNSIVFLNATVAPTP